MTSENGPGVRLCRVSGNNSAAAAPAITAKIINRTKQARQPNMVCNTPPIVGATIGAKAVIEPISDNSRPARAPE